MTLFLASVAATDEAEVVLARGADIIDAKNAAAGALGALQPSTVRAIVAAVAGKRPVSAVTGDLPMNPDALVSAACALVQAGVDYVKVGLFADGGRLDCVRALTGLARKTRMVGVMFADAGFDPGLIAPMRESGFAGVMLDTVRKGAGSLLDRVDFAGLRAFLSECRAQRLLGGLAGSLETPDIPRLLPLQPDVLGFRGALCVGEQRIASIDPERVKLVRDLIPLDPRSACGERANIAAVDYRLLAARGYSYDPAKDEAATDRIFVHDFVLAFRIGAYGREREEPQRVRFNVDAHVIRLSRTASDMRDVVSYDLITDGIRMLVAGEHIPLLETLAERIAALVLSHPRVAGVTVRLEKLDTGAGSVGVEIRRERASEIAKVHQLYPVGAPQVDPKAAN
jgi:(5-formylfuran-3-yl)methyl phosphate synthase